MFAFKILDCVHWEFQRDQRDKAKRYSQRITGGHFLKQPKAITLVETKKRKKSMKMGDIASAEEEDEPDDIPEGFHLHEQSPHCINMTRADDYQAYLWQIVIEFECRIKSGATDIRENYSKVIQSMFWAVKANKQTILNGADPDEVLASIPDPKCRGLADEIKWKNGSGPWNASRRHGNRTTNSLRDDEDEATGSV